jgi:tetratricopeptide (TPR) repeat protein
MALAHACGPEDPRRDLAWKQAARDAEALGKHRDNSVALLWRCGYYFARRDDDALLAAVRRGRQEHVENLYVNNMEASVLYARQDFDEALRALQREDNAANEAFHLVSRGIVLAAMLGRREEAERAFDDAVRGSQSGAALGLAPAFLQLLGPQSREKSRQAARDIRERSGHLIPTWRERWYHHLLDFHADLIDADKLLKKAGESRFSQCEAHFYVGLRQLAEGKRAEAKASFRRSIDTGIFFYIEYIWSRAFLARLDDPDWLPWVPVKK